MIVSSKLRRDERGASMIEFALALPVLASFVWGIFQIGLIFQANAGMQHALGEAARYATIFPTPSNDQIQSMMTNRKFGTGNGALGTLAIKDNTSGTGAAQTVVSKDLTLTYEQRLDFLFIPGPTVTLNKSKRVYLSS